MIVRLQLLLLCVLLIAHSISSRHVRRRRTRRDLVDEGGLYGKETKVYLLNSTNFDSVYGTKNAWLVEFYANWCGHCQRFAPVYIALAEDVVGWKDVVKIAALDCAASINSAFCRDHDISHYPTLKFYHDHSPKGYKGLELTKRKTVEEIRHTVVSLLIKEQQDGRGTSWPDLTPEKDESYQDIWEDVDDNIKYQVIISEDETSLLGAELILDLHKAKDVLFKRVIEEGAKNGSQGVVVFDKKGHEISLSPQGNTREDFLKTIKTYFASKGIHLPTGDEVESHVEIIKSAKGTERSHRKADIVYQVDLENALRYSLKREIAVQKSIKGESLAALLKYIEVLAKNFPIGKNGVRFLEHLRAWISEQSSITGKAFLEKVEELEREMRPVFGSKEEWLGCKGSSSKYRGYPCGLWTLFHTLTTNAVLDYEPLKTFNSLEVLDAMVGYVKHFFGCEECSQHFQQMAEESLHGNVTTGDDSILWLWRAHNNVNKRLAGDVTEDPKHPKIQFPSQESCPTCRDGSGKWVENEALVFLKQMYGKNYINFSHWNLTFGEELESLPPPESRAPDNRSSGSSLWSSLCLPLLLTAVAAVIVLVVIMTV
ncbi:sulfhydryl oxidase 2 [Anabrus simplex]|uniref:sulfhydryl oxidase 2 n=1 Tax=Anabrus simplex TaxID=316456 RepID=UPI0035A2F654